MWFSTLALERSLGFVKLSIFLFFSFVMTFAQNPRPTPPVEADVERVVSEEIKINFSAFDSNGNFVSDVGLKDIVILENGRIHEPSSIKRIPASVLILLDVGSEISYAKRRSITLNTARALINSLREGDSIALMQYGEKAELLADWTTDRASVLSRLDERKLNLAKRSAFFKALIEAVKFLNEQGLSNRHLVIISDGVDSFDRSEEKKTALQTLFSSDINVHVVSYTAIQKKAIKEVSKNSPFRKPDLPPGAEPPLRGSTPTVSIATIDLDRAMARKRKEQIEKLQKSESLLTEITESTNGEIFLPDSEEEMIGKMVQLAENIDSQYTATYVPKKPLAESEEGEVRSVEVFSRRQGLIVRGKRKLVVVKRAF
ncbi:MAG: VWA domain-containing protein [Acidobacteria bacterium]|jgi:hypothetical protein|nr:MAG: VWA domain-containing protein [Acidobacteriota bacterium]GIU82668.1 MAG: hypothetical protein KatS3mg006_1732 [Pyrinomonadaceae bacterium]